MAFCICLHSAQCVRGSHVVASNCASLLVMSIPNTSRGQAQLRSALRSVLQSPFCLLVLWKRHQVEASSQQASLPSPGSGFYTEPGDTIFLPCSIRKPVAFRSIFLPNGRPSLHPFISHSSDYEAWVGLAPEAQPHSPWLGFPRSA